ncbi:MAG: NADH dehydrogenase (quinone) subunit D [Anaerolineae bacterium]|nr:MAG: NADH dehydrogenase (quinone) subunit D [Anaerolineae bacterium]
MTDGNSDVERIRTRFPEAVLGVDEFRDETAVTVRPEQIVEMGTFLRDDPDLRYDQLTFVSAVDNLARGGREPNGYRFDAVYQLHSLTHHRRLRLKAPLLGDAPCIASVVSVWPAANWHERETYDLMGIIFEGHPDLRRILMPDDWVGHPLRKDYPLGGSPVAFTVNLDDLAVRTIGQVTREVPPLPSVPPPGSNPDRYMLLNFGPQHPATHGVLRLVVELDGERVMGVYPDIGHLHSGIEKIAEYKTYNQVIPYTDRMDYVSPINNNLPIVLATEKLLGIEAPPRAQVLRVILCELQRLAAHLIWFGTSILDLAGVGMSLLMYAFQDRESIYDIIEMVSGARMTPSFFTVGGLRRDVPVGFVPRVRGFLDEFKGRLRDQDRLVSKNPIFLSRVEGIGHLSLEDAIAWGVSGPCLRGSGLAFDLRKEEPYLGYEDYDFDVPSFPEGDVLARYKVRMAEMWQSIRIIEQGLAKLPDGPVKVAGRKVSLPPRQELDTSMEALIPHFKLVTEGFSPPPGEVYVGCENPKGELGFYLVSDGTAKPYRCKIRGPSFSNLATSSLMAEGGLLSDLVAVVASLDITLGEVDR